MARRIQTQEKLTTVREKVSACKICGRDLDPVCVPPELLCVKCASRLPKCFSCGIVTAPEWGFLEGSIVFAGHSLCYTCAQELKRKGYLMISDRDVLYPDGTLGKPTCEELTKYRKWWKERL